jgi:hypothetical protein
MLLPYDEFGSPNSLVRQGAKITMSKVSDLNRLFAQIN